MGDKAAAALSLNHVGNVAYRQGDYAMARSLYARSLAPREEIGNKQDIASPLTGLTVVETLARR